MKRAVTAAVFAVAMAAPSTVSAVTLTVGPTGMYPTLTAAGAAARDGDVIEIAAGTYHDIVTLRANRLTVRGVGGRAVLDLTGRAISNGKAIVVSAGADATFEDIEFVGAAVPDQNGAGIRWEGGGALTVRRCVFRGNENGILGGNAGGTHPENTALIENNEFVDNGRGMVGYTHSVYFGAVDTVVFRANWSHALWSGGADIGHLFKSRAHRTLVLYNRLTAEGAHSSYEVNIPQGGEAYVIGNLIQQRVGSQRVMISFADGDGAQYPGSRLFVVHNTLVSESMGAATFVRTTQATAELHVLNNLVVGTGTLAAGGVTTTSRNVQTSAPGFVDAAAFDYHLTATSPAINAGADPGVVGMVSLVPLLQYVHPRATEARAVVGALDVGAYEFGNVTVDGGAPDAATSDVPTTDVVADVATTDVTTTDTAASDVATADVAADIATDLPADGATPPDVSAPDASASDATASDGASSDAAADASTTATEPDGCGCRARASCSAASLVPWIAVLAALRVRRRRPSAPKTPT